MTQTWYWSDWGVQAKIERAWMDGSHRQVVVSKDIVWPNGIALDVVDQRLFWCDAKNDRIESVKVDGSDRQIIVQVGTHDAYFLQVSQNVF